MVAFIAVALITAACTRVLETRMIWPDSPSSEPQCHSALGYYYLPRTLLSLQASSSKADGTQSVDMFATEVHADRNQAFCLDYLASAASIDNVTVLRNEEGLLRSVSASVEDRTPAIVTALVQTAENFAIAARSGVLPGQNDSLKIQFDPFVWEELILAKAELRRFDMCLYVEGFSFPTERMTAAQIHAAAGKWCSTDAHATPRYDPRLYTFATLPVPLEVMSTGILYRPKATHRVVILHRKSGVWELYQSKRIEMPNASPVLSIGVERAAFTKRGTALYFDDGTLTDVAIDKGSEAEGFVVIPLAVAKAIVDVPAQIIKFRIADVQSHAALIQAQGNLLTATAEYAKLIAAASGNSAASPGALPKSVSVRDGQFVGACINAGADAATCRDLQRTGR
jgi:hypothetical protein